MFSGLMLYFVSKYIIQSHVFGYMLVFCPQLQFSQTYFRPLGLLLFFVIKYTIQRHVFCFIFVFCEQLHYSVMFTVLLLFFFCQQIHYSKTCFGLRCCILSADTLFTDIFSSSLLPLVSSYTIQRLIPALLLYFVSSYTIQRHDSGVIVVFC